MTFNSSNPLSAETDNRKATGLKYVMITPALVIDEKVKSSGKAPSVDEVKNLLR